MVLYSLVIPARNEKENLPSLLREIVDVMTSLNSPWEVIVVDDGSTDGSWPILEFLRKSIPQLRAIRLKNSCGQSAALSIGFSYALGEYIITLDGDGQNNPYDIPRLIESLDGVDCVVGFRIQRRDNFEKRSISTIANTARRLVLSDNLRDSACSLKIFRAECLRHIKIFKGMHRFLPSLFMIEGYSVKEIPVSHRSRNRGKTNYSLFDRGISVFFDLCAVAWMKRRKLQLTIERTLP
jgi:glycosyltransferase involved in cell wall biosynthesis